MDEATVTHTIESLDRRLDQHLEYLRGRALACPPGGGRAWDEALGHYQIGADPAHLRVECAMKSGQRAGATVEEFERALTALARFAGDELEQVLPSATLSRLSLSPPSAHRVEMFRARLRSFVSIERERYGRDVGAREHAPQTVGGSVSSVFANAQSTAKLAPWANIKVDPSTIMSCFTCGAPQEKPLDFKCRYCKNAMYEKR